MSWLIQRLRIPASESHLALLIGLCAVVMSSMVWVIVWQASIIAQQKLLIRLLVH